MSEQFEKAIKRIDDENSKDSRTELFDGEAYPKELLYSHRMTERLMLFAPQSSEELQIATRAQHIGRWKIPRNSYPMDRIGYLKWREDLKKMHANVTSDILKQVGYDTDFINRVTFLINKKLIKKDGESQTLEDVVCLVFLEHYFEAFSKKHDAIKLIDIIEKTWKKMSLKGQEEALKLKYSSNNLELIKKAIS